MDSNLSNKYEKSLIMPVTNSYLKKEVNLVIYNDNLDITLVYLEKVINKFGDYFKSICLISDEKVNINTEKNFIVANKPNNLIGDWSLILEPGEFPSIQLLDNLDKVLLNLGKDIRIVKLPIVICNFANGEIIDLLDPLPRIFRQKTQILKFSNNEEIVIDNFPLIKFYIDYSKFDENN